MNQEQIKTKNEQTHWEQEFEDFGNEATNRMKELVEEGKVRCLVIRKDGDVLTEVPLIPAIIGGAIMTIWMPFITVIAVVGAFMTKLKLEVVNIETATDETESIEVTA